MKIRKKNRSGKLLGCAAAIALASVVGMTAFDPPPHRRNECA